MPPVRRLAAILAADVAGYSRLMGGDEEGTHARLRAHLRELVDPKIAEHHGRTVKNTGDGLLVEFPSVVDAVRCAAEWQRAMIDREAEMPEDLRIRFRVGINLGDVIAEDGDIFGDGVNVAARLEGLADPGGICISRVVRDQIRDKLPYPLKDIGEQSVKNLVRPVRVYALRPETIGELPRADVPIALSRRRHSVVAPITAAIAAVLVIAVIGWWVWPPTKSSSTTPAAVAATTTIAQPFIAPRLSIVVLPFVNLSNDPDQQYFADGITEDLTTGLSRISDMLVISNNSARRYKDKPVDTKQIGRELGVRYVLEGSVQRSGNQVRINSQLIDAATDTQLWAERFDRDIGDLFALQNEITSQIASALSLELVFADAARPTDHPDALDYILRARAALAKGPGRENHDEAISLFEHALALDPGSLDAQVGLANALSGRVRVNQTNSRAADIERAERLVKQALTISPRNPGAHVAKGELLRAEGRCGAAIFEYENALASDRNSAVALFGIGICKVVSGSVDEAVSPLEQSIRLDPRDPYIVYRYMWLGTAHLLQGHTNEAIVWFGKARSASPEIYWPHASLASAYALKGDKERAAAELAEARKLPGGDLFSSIANLKAYPGGWRGEPKIRQLYEATYFAGLRKAGMPER
jgi:adenylate cyclase